MLYGAPRLSTTLTIILIANLSFLVAELTNQSPASLAASFGNALYMLGAVLLAGGILGALAIASRFLFFPRQKL